MSKLTTLWLIGAICATSAFAGTPTPDDRKDTKTEAAMPQQNLVDYKLIPFNTIDGVATSLKAYEGKVVLIVNVASECGYTKQYTGLEALYDKYRDQGLVVVGFPANNFGGQEPGTNEEIKEFCTTKFNVSFPMMSKISVKGDDIHPLFKYFTQTSSLPGEIKWNFNKFLLDQKGNLVARWPSSAEPTGEEISAKVLELLRAHKSESKS